MRFRDLCLTCFITLIEAISLAGCGTVAATHNEAAAAKETADALHSEYRKLAQSGGKLFQLDAPASSIRIYAFRGGNAARLGHSHVISAPEFTGFFYLPPEGERNARFDLNFPLAKLEIDNPQYRAALGGAFGASMTEDDISGTRRHMLGASNLDAEHFPTVRIHSLQIVGDAPRFAVKTAISLHGVTREYWIPVAVEGLPEHLKAAGSFVLRQSEFGIAPYSVLGGLLAVEDELVLEFQLEGSPAARN